MEPSSKPTYAAKELSTLYVGSSISIMLHSAAEIRTQGNYYSELSIKDES